MTLALKGHEVIEAGDGAEAVQLAQCHQPDIVLMDVVMPKMDGFEALERLKASAATVHIPVIMISAAYVRPEDIQRSLELGASAHLKKPFGIGELREEVKKHAKKKPGGEPRLNPNPYHNRKEPINVRTQCTTS